MLLPSLRCFCCLAPWSPALRACLRRLAQPDLRLAPSTASTPAQVQLGYLPQGGIYATDLLQLEPVPAAAAAQRGAQAAAAATAGPPPPLPQQLPQPEVRGLTAPNLSVSAEGAPGSAPARLVLRLWADRDGRFDAAFTLVLPPHGQEVRCVPGSSGAGEWCQHGARRTPWQRHLP